MHSSYYPLVPVLERLVQLQHLHLSGCSGRADQVTDLAESMCTLTYLPLEMTSKNLSGSMVLWRQAVSSREAPILWVAWLGYSGHG